MESEQMIVDLEENILLASTAVKARRRRDAGTSYLQRDFAWIRFVQIVSDLR